MRPATLPETIIHENITLCRPQCTPETANVIFAVIDKCRDVFLPWLGWVKETETPADTLAFLQGVDADWNAQKQFVYSLFIGETFIGLVSVLNVAWAHNRAEIAYWLDTDYTGRGLMSQAVTMLEHALWRAGFNRLVIHTDVLNIQSAKIPQRLGYTHEGVLRQELFSTAHNRYRDINVFSKLRMD